ncbi:MAG: mechanosensitive ion channel domain-containing protein [Candidatus Brocadiia bacterium]
MKNYYLHRLLLCLWLCTLMCFFVRPLTAGEPGGEPDAIGEQELSTPQQIDQRIEQIKAEDDLTEETRTKLENLYVRIKENLQSAAQNRERINTLTRERENAPAKLKQLKQKLEQIVPEPEPDVPEKASFDELETRLNGVRAAFKNTREEVAQLDAELKRRAERRAELADLQVETRKQLEALEEQIEATSRPPASDRTGRAEYLLLRSRAQDIRTQLAAYEEELRSYDARRELLATRRELAARRVAHYRHLAEKWREIVSNRRQKEAQETAEEAVETTEQMSELHSRLGEIASENQQLVQQRTGPEGLLAEIKTTSSTLDELQGKLAKLEEEFSMVKEKVEAAGLANAIGRLLLRKEANLPQLPVHRRKIKQRRAKMANVQFHLIELEEQRSNLADLNRAVSELMSEISLGRQAPSQEKIRSAARELLSRRREYLDALIRDYNRYFGQLVDLQIVERGLVSTVREYGEYIGERVLWVQNTQHLASDTFRKAFAALAWLVDPGNWRQAGRAFWHGLGTSPGVAVAALIILLVLIWARSPIRSRLVKTAERLHKTPEDKFSYTLEAIGMTMAFALLWPGLLWFIGWKMGAPVTASPFARSVGAGLRLGAGFFLLLQFLRVMCFENGLVDKHFRLREEAARFMRRHLAWFMCIFVTVCALHGSFNYQPNTAWQESLGRIAFMIETSSAAIFFALAFRPSAPLVRAYMRRHRESYLQRIRYLLYGLIILLPICLTVAAAFGYYHTATELGRRLFWTTLLFVTAGFANAVVVRWLVLQRRRLAVKEAEERREEEDQKETSTDGTEFLPAEEPEGEQSLYTLSQQTRRFVAAGLGFGLLIGLWMIWSEIVPALGILEQVELWSITAKVGADGAGEATEAIEQTIPITLADCFGALIIVVLTVIATRNVPGLLNIFVLKNLPLDRGVSFAITTLSRYCIIAVGAILAFGQIGLGWSKVQWLVAAMGVGLGFGLQEIFANFISGLIILFERPMRVGDTVTVGETSGTVTRIRIRATTITDWDRKELVVPNREFVTGRLINWSLSDTVLRLKFQVGVAYGSDVELAEETLLEIAKSHPVVLEEPPPKVVFEGFGDSCLNLELRLFVPDLESRIQVGHEIHRSIDSAFREAGLEIAFPQMDVHMRRSDAELPVRLKKDSGDQDGETQ